MRPSKPLPMKKYKVIKLTKSNNTSSGFDTLIADLSEIKNFNIVLPDSGSTPFTFDPEKIIRFIIPQNNPLADCILRDPEEVVEIDFNEFKAGYDDHEENLKIKEYIHRELLELKNATINENLVNGTEIREGLKKAYTFLVEERNSTGKMEDPLVYSLFTNDDSSVKAFIVAKDPNPNEEIVLCYLESVFTNKNDLVALPLSNIKALQLKPRPFKPFRIKRYLEKNIRECTAMDTINHYLTMNNHFEKDLFLLRLSENLEYQAIESDRLIINLPLTKGINGIPTAIISSYSTISYSKSSANKFEFQFEEGILGPSFSPRLVSPIILFNLLIEYCFGAKDKNDLFTKMYNTRNPNLVYFANRLETEFYEATDELVALLNSAELNPKITIDDITYGKTNPNILILNPYITKNIFKRELISNMIAEKYES